MLSFILICDSVWPLLVEPNPCRLSIVLQIHFSDPILKRGAEMPLIDIGPTHVCVSRQPEPGFTTPYVVICFVLNGLR